jgi:hypothetical protein
MERDKQDQLNKAIEKVMKEAYFILLYTSFRDLESNPDAYDNMSSGLDEAFDILVGNLE